MYIPASFKMEDKQVIYDFMEQNSFAILFTYFNDLPYATHLPFLLDRSEGCLYGHMAKANPQWHEINDDVLVAFHGPHAYISPSWYETDQAVPTWNYAAVHVTGKFILIEDHNELKKILDRTANSYESSMPQPWSMSSLDPKLLSALSDAIVGFKIEILKIEGKWKLSQNHSEDRREKVIQALETKQDDNSKRIADLMKSAMESEENDIYT
jgi:transcriptional regulator